MTNEEFNQQLKSKLTDEFLQTLIEAVQGCNWEIDMSESIDFANWCFELAGKKHPDWTDLLDFEE
jgi:hypothetical protein